MIKRSSPQAGKVGLTLEHSVGSATSSVQLDGRVCLSVLLLQCKPEEPGVVCSGEEDTHQREREAGDRINYLRRIRCRGQAQKLKELSV